MTRRRLQPSPSPSGLSTVTLALFAAVMACAPPEPTPDTEPPAAPQLSATDPVSPSSDRKPSIRGTAEAGAVVRVYLEACQGSPVAALSAEAFASTGVIVAVTADATTRLTADAVDASGNVSPCATPLEYVHDGALPVAAVVTGTTPVSPSNVAAPVVRGQAEAGSRIALFSDAACARSLGEATASAEGNFELTVTVAQDSSTRFYALVTDGVGNTTGCRDTGVRYDHDGAPPDAPELSGTTPPSPAPSNTPTLSGTSEAGSLVQLFATEDCSGTPVATTTAGSNGFSVEVNVADDSTNLWSAEATDAAGNRSACSASAVSYVEDERAPEAPVIVSLSPSSPANSATAMVQGSAEAGAMVRLFLGPTCDGAEVASGFAIAGAYVFEAAVERNGVTVFSARATDEAGNEGACSEPSPAFVEDSVPPAAPLASSLVPSGPTSGNAVQVSGNAEVASVVSLFAEADCSSALVTATADAEGRFTAEVRVSDDTRTRLYLTAVDAAGNRSPCVRSTLEVLEDSTAPARPTLAAVSPAVSTSQNSGVATGSAEPGSLVQLFTDEDCSARIGTGGPANAAGVFALAFEVRDDSTTRLFAAATDAAGNASACSSTSVVFVEDSRAPDAPVVRRVTPSAPTAGNSGVLAGTAEPGARVQVFGDAGCTRRLEFSTIAGTSGDWVVGFEVADNTVTTLAATATDSAGNTSTCSTTTVTFREDSTAPAVPLVEGFSPVPPANDNRPAATGTAEPNATLRLYTDADCTGEPLATTTVNDAGRFNLRFPVADDSVTALYLRATDAAGNTSACPPASSSFTEDSRAPLAPTLASTTPAGPANVAGEVTITGTAEVGSTVRIHANAGCTDTSSLQVVAGPEGAFSVVAPVAADATNAFYATATDPSGNRSGCSTTPLTFVEDSTAPIAPVLSATAPASPSTSTTPNVSGSAEAGATVRLYASGACSGTPSSVGIAGANGLFSIGVTLPADASTSLVAAAVDASGNVSPCSTAISYVSDNLAPARPTISGTNPASPSSSTTPAVNGSAEAGSVVTLFTTGDCSGSARGTATAAVVGGAFSITVNPPVAANSTTTFSVNATDAVGNVSLCSAGRTFVSDGSAPSTPRITSSTPASPSRTSTTPTLAGSADAGTTVRLFRSPTCGGAVVVSVTASAQGSFLLSTSVTANTSTVFTVNSTDAANNTSICSSAFTYVHDAAAPTAPTIASSLPASPSSASLTPLLRGAAESGAVVRVYRQAGCLGAVAATVTADASNAFEATLAATANSSNPYAAQATDAAGNVGPCSSTFTYIHDSLAPATPSITQTTPVSPSNSVLTPTVVGSAETGSTVSVYAASNCGGAVIGTTVAAAGAFSLTVTVAANSSNSLTAKATDAAGNISACSTARPYVHDSIAPPAPVLTGATPTSPSSGPTPTFTATGTAGTTLRVFTNATCTGTATTSVAMTTTTVSFSLNLPQNAASVVTGASVDDAGNISPCSTRFDYVRDTVKPAAPALTGSTPASPSNSSTPQLTGTAEAGATVRIYSVAGCGSGLAGTGVATAGTFSIGVTAPSNASTTYFATATDAAGNLSGCSTTGFTFVHDSIAPAAPAISGTTPESPSSGTTTPTFNGTAEAGATVQLFTSSNCSGSPVASGPATAGNFAVPAPVTANASTTLFASARDPAGNSSACSSGRTFIHDALAPAAPILSGTTPLSPATGTAPVVAGTAEASTTVNLYATDCGGTAIGTGTVSAGGTFSVATTVPANASTSLRATVTDAAGNVSPCSTALPYVSDSTAPVFAGAFSASAVSGSSITLTWASATDTFTPQASIAYDVCQSASPNGCLGAFTVTNTTAAGATSLTIAGLVADTRYYYVVRARDLAGNRDTNQVLVAAKTMGVATTRQVSGGSFHECALTSTGEVFCWGLGTSGQIGDGQSTTARFPVRVPGLTNVKAIAVGYWHTLALLDDGRVFAWGQNTEGQLGDGTTANKATPVLVPGLTGVRAIAAGASASCALLGAGSDSLRCWGDNTYGQLGDGTSTRRTAPTYVPLLQVVSIHAGPRHFCAVVGDRTVRCWGQNNAGQLGDGTQVGKNTPTAIPFLTNVRTVAGGHSHSCAVLFDGTVRCWGRNDLGQLGDGTTTGRNNHLPVTGLTDAIAVATGYHQSCALLSTNGQVKCWGYNASGSVGDNSTTNRLTPVSVIGLTSAASIAVGDNSCAVLANGSVRCWGENSSYQLGNGVTTNALMPVTPNGLLDVSAGKLVAATTRTTCGVTADGGVRCWGQGSSGQLGNGGNANSVVPVEVSGLAGVVAITSGVEHFCALRAAGTVACWGRNNVGQLGDGTTTDGFAPVTVVGLAGAKAIAAGADHSCAVVADGTLRCWGGNSAGQFGSGAQAAPNVVAGVTPAFAGVTNIVQVTAGAGFTCVLTGNGTPRCSGLSTSGQLGTGLSTGSLTPVAPALTNVASIVSRLGTTCVVLTDGTVRCWGANNFGQLGDGTKVNAATPVTWAGASNALSVVVGNQSTCVQRANGQVSCVGGNQAGQLGVGNTTDSLTAVNVTGLTEVATLAAGPFHLCALRSDGTPACWGANDTGQLGDLTATMRSTPVGSLAFP